MKNPHLKTRLLASLMVLPCIGLAATNLPPWQDIPMTHLPLSLHGTLDLPGNRGIAIMQHAKRQFVVNAGEQLPHFPQVRLLEVRHTYALLQHGNHLEKMALGIATPAPRQETPQTRLASVSADELANTNLKAFRDRVALDPYLLGEAVTVEAIQAAGKLTGYRLMPGSDPALFLKAGLKPSDLLLAVNGVRLESETQAIALLEQYAGAIQLSLTLQRGQEEINLPINFQELGNNGI